MTLRQYFDKSEVYRYGKSDRGTISDSRKDLFFDPVDFDIKRGEHVIVETARGIEYGTVVGDPKEIEEEKVIQPLKPVLRVASSRDMEQEAANKEKEKEAFKNLFGKD